MLTQPQTTYSYLEMVGSGVKLSTALVFTAKGLLAYICGPCLPVVLTL